MSNDNKSILGFDFNFICEYFKHLERQGPGSPEVTLKAASYIPALAADAIIADLGCGTGGQTMTLARALNGQITGVDLFPEFIDIFSRNAATAGLSDRVKGVVGSMAEPPFECGVLDLIWSEGAIYNVGFEAGLRLWRDYLKPGGYVAVTEASWLTPQRPDEIEKFWTDAYSGIGTWDENIGHIENGGYQLVSSFLLPENCWVDNFFEPQIPLQEEFMQKYGSDPTIASFIEYCRYEYGLYKRYKEYYGYVFYIARKV